MSDVGGGTGSWTVAVVEAHPDMSVTVVELPAAADIVRGIPSRCRSADSNFKNKIPRSCGR
jgi:precorrin-6B methylase 2